MLSLQLLYRPTSTPLVRTPTPPSSKLSCGRSVRRPANAAALRKRAPCRCVRSPETEAPAAAVELPAGLQRELMPRHVAVIMDGNSRWARGRGLPSSAGHEAGSRALKETVKLSCMWGIGTLTVYAFSAENWLRPKMEVDFLMTLFERVLKDNLLEFMREGIRICIIGDLSKLPKPLVALATEVEESTKNNFRLNLLVAMSYSGRNDIVQACRKIAQKVKHGLVEPPDITETLVAQELGTNCSIESPYPDLLIRTSGELRLSNFLLWESAYSELYFAKAHWPDFGEAEYAEALRSFQRRQRRFGLRTDT